MRQPLRPFGTACWLVCNTALTDRQIAAYTGVEEAAVAALRRDGPPPGTIGLDPVATGSLTVEEIDRCAGDPAADLQAIVVNGGRVPGERRAL